MASIAFHQLILAQNIVGGGGPKFNIVDILIVVALIGGALFAVCKSGMRR